MESKSFVVRNIPEIVDKEEYLTNYLEVVLDQPLEKLQCLPQLPDRALFTLQKAIDVEKAALTVSDNLLEDCQLEIEPSIFSHAVIAEGEDLIEKVTPFFVKRYFQSQFGQSEETVSRCLAVEDFEMILVCFKASEDLADILKDPIHGPLPPVGYEMRVCQFCDNFHGLIPYGNKLLYQVVGGVEDESICEQGQLLDAECHPKATQSRDEECRGRQEVVVREIPDFDLKEKVQFQKNLPKSRSDSSPKPSQQNEIYPPHHSVKQSSTSQSLSSLSSVNRKDQNEAGFSIAPESAQIHNECPRSLMKDKLEDKMLTGKLYGEKTETAEQQSNHLFRPLWSMSEGKTFDQRHTTVSSEFWSQASDNGRPRQSHTFLQMHGSEHKNGMPELVQNKNAPRKINFPLRKSHWYVLKDSLRAMNLCSLFYDAVWEILAFESVNADELDSENIEDLVADVIESKEEVSESMLKVFKTPHGKDYFRTYVLSELSGLSDIFVDIRDGFLICCGLDEDKIDEVKRKVRADLFNQAEVGNQILGMEDVEELKESLEHKYKVHIIWNKETDNKIRITGVEQDVTAAKDLIQTNINDNTTATKYFELCGDVCAYILENCQEEIDSILKNVESLVDCSHDKFSIEYSGKLQDIQEVSSALEDIRISLKLEEIDVANELSRDEASLVMKELSLLSPDGFFQHAHDLFMAKHKCLILNDLEEESDFKTLPSATAVKRQKKEYSRKTCVSKDAIFILSPLTQLKIKDKGNIIHERSDVLVCVLDESRKLSKTNISKAFLSVEKDLQNIVDRLSFSSVGVELVPFPSCKMKCKAIVFVALSAFEQGDMEDCLQQAILEVLIKAAEFKATSVSFPPIGLGRVLKYPENVISGQFFSAVKEFLDNPPRQHQLRKIKLLACSSSLFYTLNNKGKTLFRKIRKDKDTRDEKNDPERRNMEDHVMDGDNNLPMMNANIRIIHRRKCKGLASLWKTELKNYVSHEEEFDTLVESLPKSLFEKIQTKLKTIPVLITSRKSKLHHCVLKVKGPKDRVMQIKAYIAGEIVKEGKGHSQASSLSAAAPRGTVAFMKYLASLDLSVPTYWKKKDGSASSLHSVKDKTRKSIEKLLLATWNSTQVGVGRDAAGIPTNSKLEFVSVQRVECPATYRIYAAARKAVLERKVQEAEVCKKVHEISSNKQSILTSVDLPDFMNQELCGEINECYLFHGTKPDLLDSIIKQGFQPSLTSSSAMFGKGVYAAESSTKADQYTDDPRNRLPSGSIHSIFLLRALLGDVFKCTKKHPSVNGKDSDKFVRPPCKRCGKDRCSCGDNFDSVMGEGGWIFREFVIYQNVQCYPEYLIKYKRVY